MDMNSNIPKQKHKVPLRSVIKEFNLEEIYVPENLEKIMVEINEVNRPGLQLTGFFDHFESSRIQIIGKAEYHYLLNMTSDERKKSLDQFFSKKVVCVVFSSGLDIFEETIECAKEYGTPVFRTQTSTSHFVAALISYLNLTLAPCITRHGVLVEVYGEGILILGDSGIGKSEIAIELVKRGHRLIADDAVEIKKVSEISLVGSAPEIIRHYVEIRGIGVVDIRRIFGMGAVKLTEKIELVIELEQWDNKKEYDRLGIDTQTKNILGVEVPMITVPVKPGRNLAIIIEIAAMNNRQKVMGYNAALELNEKLEKKFNSQEIL